MLFLLVLFFKSDFFKLRLWNNQNYSLLALQSAALKEAIDDLEWPGSSIQIKLQPVPPSVSFRGEGHGDLQVSAQAHLF